jgi:hypothetical protein
MGRPCVAKERRAVSAVMTVRISALMEAPRTSAIIAKTMELRACSISKRLSVEASTNAVFFCETFVVINSTHLYSNLSSCLSISI